MARYLNDGHEWEEEKAQDAKRGPPLRSIFAANVHNYVHLKVFTST